MLDQREANSGRRKIVVEVRIEQRRVTRAGECGTVGQGLRETEGREHRAAHDAIFEPFGASVTSTVSPMCLPSACSVFVPSTVSPHRGAPDRR